MTHLRTTPSDDAILILYSSPEGIERLRIDKEHRAVDEALRSGLHHREMVVRLHAPTFDDIVRTLRERSFTVIQFSGHGAPNGILVEAKEGSGGLFLDQSKICSILRLAAPSLKAAIFMSCFSSGMSDALVQEVPYLIVTAHEADDQASIEFAAKFYEDFFRSGSIRSAYLLASAIVQDSLDTTLYRRGLGELGNRAFVSIGPLQAVYNEQAEQDVLIDVSAVETELLRIGVQREKFLSLLTHKIRIHAWAFRYPRENALFSVGPYFALCSWQNAYDIVRCTKIMKLRRDADEGVAEEWARLMVTYHDAYVQSYRRPLVTGVQYEAEIGKGLEHLQGVAKVFFKDEKRAALLRRGAEEVFKAAKAQIGASLEMADTKFHQGSAKLAVPHLEAALSTIHDLINAISDHLLE